MIDERVKGYLVLDSGTVAGGSQFPNIDINLPRPGPINLKSVHIASGVSGSDGHP